MRRRTLLALVLTALAFPASAGAAVIQDFSVISATNGIALGMDGNFWVAEEFSGSVARMTPAGEVIGRFQVGDRPTAVVAGSDGSVWATVKMGKVLARFDSRAPSPTPQLIPTNAASGCGPVGLAHGGDRVFVSFPSD